METTADYEIYCEFDSPIVNAVEIQAGLLVKCADGTAYIVDEYGEKRKVTFH